MMPVSETTRPLDSVATSELRGAAAIARDAANFLAGQDSHSQEGRRYRIAAERMNAALGSPRITRLRLLMSSPAVLESSGRTRTLIEMIEAEPDQPSDRLRLAKLLLRALIWIPRSFPFPVD